MVPGWVAGGLFAAPPAAIMSTVDSMLLIVSGSIVRDLYVNDVKPDVGHNTQTRLSSAVTLGAGVVVLLLSFGPQDFLEYLLLFAIGGLEAAIMWPLLLGLYRKRGNALGAGLSSVAGPSPASCSTRPSAWTRSSCHWRSGWSPTWRAWRWGRRRAATRS